MSADRGSKKGRIVLRPGTPFTAVKIFSATMFADRAALGARITDWITDHTHYEVIEIVQTQSSDSAFHCLTFTVFYRPTA